MTPDRGRALAGAAGLVAVTLAWGVGAARTPGYDPVRQSLSQLQRTGRPTGPLMTGGFTALGAGLLLTAPVLGRVLGSRAARHLLALAGTATLVAAAFPLAARRGLPQDLPHMAAASVGYVCVSVLPLVGGRRLRGRPAALAWATGAVTTAAMAGTVPLHAVSGGLQRLGLTLGTGWAVGLAVARTGRRRGGLLDVAGPGAVGLDAAPQRGVQ